MRDAPSGHGGEQQFFTLRRRPLTSAARRVAVSVTIAGAALELGIWLIGGALVLHGDDVFFVIAIALVLGVATDQAAFLVGREYGDAWIGRRRPSWRRAAARARAMLVGGEVPFVILFRFCCGMGTLAPVIAGVSGMSPKRFLALNTLGAALWAFVASVVVIAGERAIDGFAGGPAPLAAMLEGIATDPVLPATLACIGAIVAVRRRSRARARATRPR